MADDKAVDCDGLVVGRRGDVAEGNEDDCMEGCELGWLVGGIIGIELGAEEGHQLIGSVLRKDDDVDEGI